MKPDEEPRGPESAPPGKGFVVGPTLGQFLTLGLQLGIAVVVFFFAGRWLDDKFSTTPLWTLVGAAIGITGGLIKFFKTTTTFAKQADREIEKRQQQG
jgi:F0F1-type ATP synthase assembly protein I